MFWQGIIITTTLLMFIVFYFMHPDFFLRKKNIRLIRFPARNLEIKVELAANPYHWTQGLMFRESMDKDQGMLFIFPNEMPRSFWMKNTLIPLDLIFLSRDKKVIDVKENFTPCPDSLFCPSYVSRLPAQYVLEINAGLSKQYNLQLGDSAEFNEFPNEI